MIRPARVLRAGWLTSAMLLLTAMRAAAGEPGAARELRDASALREQGSLKSAIAALKSAVKAHPDDERLRHALAMAYVDDNNAFWALKVLRQYTDAHRPACATRALMAWIQTREANLDLADELLTEGGCDAPPEMRARFLLLRARIAAQRGDRAGARQLESEARSSPRLYEEDLALLDALRDQQEPGHLPWADWRIDLAGGWMSNGLAGSPVDPADLGVDTSTALLSADARLRLVLPASPSIRPVLDVQLRALEQLSGDVRFLSYRQPSVRPGVMFGGASPRLVLSYGFDAVQIEGGDRYGAGPLWYSEAHRLDYEIEATESLFVFGGGGRRLYREQGRTRWEAEQGLGLAVGLARGLRLMAGASARWNRARNTAYDEFGGTALMQLLLQLPAHLEARLNGSVTYDDYPRSAGYFAGSGGAARSDWQLRVKPGIWSPSWRGFRIGLDYELSHRRSTAEAYSYDDHRFLLHGTWALDSDRLGVTVIPVAGREPMRHGVGESGGLGDDELRIRDLMRQDETVKRGSSCLN